MYLQVSTSPEETRAFLTRVQRFQERLESKQLVLECKLRPWRTRQAFYRWSQSMSKWLSSPLTFSAAVVQVFVTDFNEQNGMKSLSVTVLQEATSR